MGKHDIYGSVSEIDGYWSLELRFQGYFSIDELLSMKKKLLILFEHFRDIGLL